MSKFRGDGGDYGLSAATATSVAIPAAANLPDGDYELIISNNTGSNVFFRFTTGTANGVLIADGEVSTLEFEGGVSGFVYQSSGSTVTLDYSLKELG